LPLELKSILSETSLMLNLKKLPKKARSRTEESTLLLMLFRGTANPITKESISSMKTLTHLKASSNLDRMSWIEPKLKIIFRPNSRGELSRNLPTNLIE